MRGIQILALLLPVALTLTEIISPKGYHLEIISNNAALNGTVLRLLEDDTLGMTNQNYAVNPPLRLHTSPDIDLDQGRNSSFYRLLYYPFEKNVNVTYLLALEGPYSFDCPIKLLSNTTGDNLQCVPGCERVIGWQIKDTPGAQKKVSYGGLSSSKWFATPTDDPLGAWTVLRTDGERPLRLNEAEVTLVLRKMVPDRSWCRATDEFCDL